MLRRPVAALAAVLLAVALAAPAGAALVRVRVEGKSQTIFGASEPRVNAANALEALEAASAAGEFYYHVTQTSFGPYVDQIGRFPASGTTGWVFKVNGAGPPVGADKVELRDGDVVLWYHAQFGIVPGGPPTLRVSRVGRGNCYRVVAHDDAGSASSPPGAVLTVDGRRVRTRAAGQAAVGCVGRHRGVVRAVSAAAVRSNAVR
jgi:hypothetical protein